MNLLTTTCSLFPAPCSLLPVPCSLLAIDSATSILSVAVCRGEEIFYKEASRDSKISESVMSVIDALLKEAGLKPADLNGVICMEGPGSFTGLRVGYSIAKGLALSLNIPFIAVPAIQKIIKEGGDYFYIDKRGYAKELLTVGRTMNFDNNQINSAPNYASN